MARVNYLLAGTAALALTACADLGFGDFPLAEGPGGAPGPVQVAEINGGTPITVLHADGTKQTVMMDKPATAPPVAAAAPKPMAVASAAPAPAMVAKPRTTPMASIVPTPKAPAAPAQTFGPDDAKPGECYARVQIPAVTKTTTKQVLVTPATTKTETVPATYKTVTEEVMVKPATTKTETVPATYKTETKMVPVEGASGTAEPEMRTVTEEVLVSPEEVRSVDVPAVYENVTERVKVADARQEWRPGGKVYAIGAEALGGTILANRVTSAGVMALVEVPAEFETVTKRVLVTPATTREETVPAQYETVTKRVPVEGAEAPAQTAMEEVTVRVVDTPATTRTVTVPAEFKTETRRVVDTPAMTRTVPVAAVYRDEDVVEEIEPARTEWAQVLCDANAVPDLVKSLQRALAARDLYKGPIDGKIGRLTRGAIKQYQNGASDVLTLESARALGLAI